jgi:hypothetical protein
VVSVSYRGVTDVEEGILKHALSVGRSMLASVAWKWKAEPSQPATGSSISRFSPLEAFAEWGYPLPRNPMESSMKTHVFTPSHETGILVAHILPYAGSDDTRLGRESS